MKFESVQPSGREIPPVQSEENHSQDLFPDPIDISFLDDGEDGDWQDFIATRKIAPEEYELLGKLKQFKPSVYVDLLHNQFNMGRERSVEQMERQRTQWQEQLSDPSFASDLDRLNRNIAVYDLFLEFLSHRPGDWAAGYHLVRMLERP